mmetsp:Transcript_71114/g.199860  ORF Transcript_71114/g.199860 Transcript_71114/m.199860 type:complete len:427 (-) Transcript_71114:202-1482(-)|eukprot:CAMPEP_0119483954 /NCGR_PEP_ID=MMETSP1344-20130328/11127_1 /TAXON_ID=236787 /ORGANISM="Florenciella parvula, Strain CCMP2471" /LENGTH=426 /DNA_ID=CAMNT_0007518485 /DNA_START=83 /DNA_END=1363 /DNA_ORIENTATION=+
MSAVFHDVAETKQLIMEPAGARTTELETKASTPPTATHTPMHHQLSGQSAKPHPPPTYAAYPATHTPDGPTARGPSAKRTLKDRMATALCCQQPPDDDPNRSGGASLRNLGDFNLGRQLGEGASASVYEGLDTEFGVRVALKLVGISSKSASNALLTPIAARSSAATAYANEKSALEAVAHPHVLSLLSHSDREQHKGRRASLLVLERCPNGEIYHVMEKLGALDELVARTYAHQLWDALAACHDQLVFHRDIKPENLLLAEDWSLRVADFGLATVGRAGLMTNTCGTSGYMAPEVYRPRGGHDPARADVWAATCVTFILAMGSPPVTTACPKCWFFRQILNNRWDNFWKAHEKFGPTLSDEFKAFIQRGLNPIMLARPSVESMVNDPLFELPTMSSTELQSYMNEAMMPHVPVHEEDLDSSYEAS